METSSSIITTLGAGSGINMAQLASDLAAAQFLGRTERLSAKSEQLTAQISAASTLKNAITTLASSFGDRVRTGDLAAAPSLANSAVAKASVPFGSSGKGSYSLEVTQLAKRQALSSGSFASATSTVGAGTLTLRFGTIDGSFSPDAARDPVDITIASGATLADVASAINASESGVTAYVANTTTGARLVLKGEEGAANGFVLEAAETEPGLAALAWEPATGDPDQLLATASDATFFLDGLPMTSASNNTGTVAPGLQLTLTGTNIGAPTQITFSNPSDAVSSTMTDLVAALNELVTAVKDVTNKDTGELRSDPGARALKQALTKLTTEVVMPNATGDEPRTLSDLGLTLSRDGSFTLDSERLTATLERDPDAVSAMFTTGIYGVYSTLDKLSRNTTSISNPSSLGGSIARYQRMSAEITEQTTELAEKQEDLRVRMVARFAKADTQVAASQSTLTFLQQQIDAWNAQNN